jgi:hypothetical protein
MSRGSNALDLLHNMKAGNQSNFFRLDSPERENA